MHVIFAIALVLSIAAKDPPATTPPRVDVVYETDDALNAAWAALLQLDGRVARLTDAASRVVPWGHPLPVSFQECGSINAYYFHEPPRVVVCYEFMDFIFDAFASVSATEEAAIDATISATVGVLAHELGHATVAALDLPIVARGEDVADAFAVWVMARLLRDTGPTVAMGQFWRLLHLAGETGSAEDEHSPTLVRYYNWVCWSYGADPDGNAWLAAPLGDRIDECADEYAQIDRSWIRLLTL